MTLPHRTTNETTELTKMRNHLAADRTLTSWIQNSLGLIGFGAGFETISKAVGQSFPQSHSTINQTITYPSSIILAG
jgi:putative membrane protein